jgi:GMP reductase
MKFDFDDIVIKPAMCSSIDSRKMINPYLNALKLPLFTAPMDTVVNSSNIHIFQRNFNICLPRLNNLAVSNEHFYSYGYDDFYQVFNKLELKPDETVYALIDVANGHMLKLYDYVHKFKDKFGKQLVLMVGNVATPETFSHLQEAGADYIRVGIGNGNGCLTTVQTGVGYPMASLIQECKEIRDQNCYNWVRCTRTQIVADGGFKKYADIIKALALGADYVMLGSMLNKMLESCAPTLDENGNLVNPLLMHDRFVNNNETFYKEFRGMSTKTVQKLWGKDETKTSEGIETVREVEYTYDSWVNNFIDYLASAMSYTGAYNLEQFIGKPKIIEISYNSFNRFNK